MKKYVLFICLMMSTAILILVSEFALPTTTAIIILLTAVTSDFYTTYRCLKVKGKEGNPAVAFLLRKVGIGGTFAVMAGIWVAFILLHWIEQREGVQTATALAYWLVPINNLIVLKRLQRKQAVQAS